MCRDFTGLRTTQTDPSDRPGLDGKEGVIGSSPMEGSTRNAAVAEFRRFGAGGRRASRDGVRLLLADGTVAAEGRSIVVAWSPTERTARPLTPDERATLERRI
jgi:hypothetical protein